MKLIDNVLYLEVPDAVACGLGSENYISKEKSRGAKWAVFIQDPKDNRKVLIEFESLPDKKKKIVIDYFGNPYEALAKDPICKMVVPDTKAEAFFLTYTYGDDHKKLPIDVVKKYSTACSWMNMLMHAQENFKEIKKDMGISVAKFWEYACELIGQRKINLPTFYKRLQQKISQYKEQGYKVMIHGQYDNKHAAKVDDEVAAAVLLELIAMPNSDNVITARRYNTWAVENNKPQITDSTVGNWKSKHEAIIFQDKYGVKENYNRFGKHIARSRPSAPLLLVEHDDNELDLYYQSITKTYYFNRFVVAVVMDAYNDYILGWAHAPTYTKELIKLAYLDAVYHVKELTGNWYLPHQIRSDRFGVDVNLTNDLAQFYKSLAIYTPAKAKVARSKYIERSFGVKWHQVLGMYKNYAGTNVTSKQGKISEEFREANKKDYPTVDQAPAQIASFINTMRCLVNDKTGKSKQQEWVDAFNASEKSKKHLINETQLLLKLGTPHDYQNTITNRGITPAINCVERIYEIPEKYYLKTIGKKVQVVYDPYDYSRILVTDNESLLFIAHAQELMPSALADFKPGDRSKLNARLAEKVRHMETINKSIGERKDTLRLNAINAESLIKAGVHTKEINHQALVDYSPLPIETPTQRKPTRKKSAEDFLNDM